MHSVHRDPLRLFHPLYYQGVRTPAQRRDTARPRRIHLPRLFRADGHTDRGWLFAVTTLWILLGLLPLALLTSSSVTLSDQAVRDEVRDRVETTASVSRVVVEQQMSSLKQLVRAYARRPGIRTEVSSGDITTRSVLAGHLRELASLRTGVTGVIVTRPSGRLMGAEPPGGLSQDMSTTDWYMAIRGGAQTYVSQAYTPTMQGVSRAVAVAAPIPAAGGGGPIGILAVVYSLDAIQDFASQAANAQEIRLIITDQSGVLVADPGRQLYALTSLREDPRVDAALAGRTLFTTYRDVDGMVLSASEPIPSIGWTVTAGVSATTALASAEQLRMRVLAIAGVLAVLILAGLVLQIHTSQGRRKAQRILTRYADALTVARDEAVRASAAKSEFLAKVSHEIRTPINGVLGMNALLLGTRIDDEQRHYASTAQESARNLLRLLDDFLDLSKIEAGRLEVERVPFDLPRLCDEVIAPLAPQAYRQGLWLTLHLDDNLPQQVVGDPVRLGQVLTNVLGNALKFTVQGGIVLAVTLDEPTDRPGAGRPAGAKGPGVPGADRTVLRFTVTDTGVGVGPDDQERVFETFRQVGSPITRRTGGSGLGLAISRQLTELMGGQIELDSVEGVGSRFWVSLPVSVLTWSAPATEALRGMRVLVADAQPTSRALAERILTGAGLTVETAPDAHDALAILRTAALDSRPFDLAVVDLDLERVSGRDAESLADAVLSDPLLHGTGVVVLITPGCTGVAWPDVSSVTGQIVQSVTRPLSRRRLLATVENTLRGTAVHDMPPMIVRPEELESSSEASQPSAPVRILVAEDDEVSRQVARLVLRKAAHHVDVVGDGEQAVRAALSGQYDLIFMDCQLPVLDGLAATAEIRRRQEGLDPVPIIAMTAAAMPDDRARCLDAGMDDHLTKPVDWRHVLAHIPVWTATTGGSGDLSAALQDLPEEAVTEIVESFVVSTPDVLRRLREAALAGDSAEVGRLAHRLRGSCATVGAARSAALCERLETLSEGSSAVTGDTPMLTILAELTDELRRAADGLLHLTRSTARGRPG